MIEIVELRDKPELKIKLNEVGIEIIDPSQPKNCGTFLFNDIINIELKPKRTDLFITSLSWIVDLLIAGGGGKNYKNDASLKLETINQTLNIWLTNADLNRAERMTRLIENKITSKTSKSII
ncbi:hypothetical protein [uncultured Algibacter sp.]|uniref:hypothetical protein n=1 Tax=uncultured Algibacter sp. TaxID=298659 RepID=UPI00262F9B95|nr:hypothetical protein [uncultured Algibacter sp.]